MKIGKKQAVGIMISLVVGLAPVFASTDYDVPLPKDKTVINGGNSVNKLIEANKKIEEAVVTGYKAVENGVVTGYKGFENGVVYVYKKFEKLFTETFFKSVYELQEEKR